LKIKQSIFTHFNNDILSINMRLLVIITLLVCIFCVFYFSWLPNPSFVNQHYLPRWLVYWADVYVQLRTAVPFVAIGFLLQFLYKPQGFFTFKGFLLSFLLVFIAELGQFLLPYRHPDVMDIFFGVLGAILGMFFYYQTFKIRHLILAKK